MKRLIFIMLIFCSVSSIAQVQRAKDDLPENKINPNIKKGTTPTFDKKLQEQKSNKRQRIKKLKRKNKQKQEMGDMDKKTP